MKNFNINKMYKFSPAGTNKARNVTFSLNTDEKSRIEDELQSNKTANITEDNG